MTPQTNQNTSEIVIYSCRGKKRAGSPITNPYTRICPLTESLRCNQSETHEDSEDFENSERTQTPKISRIENIADLVQEMLDQPSRQFLKEMEYSEMRPTDSPLSKEIIALRFPKKFVMPTFDHYSGTSDPLLHLRQYQDKMAVYSHDDILLCRAFPSSLKGCLPLVLLAPEELALGLSCSN